MVTYGDVGKQTSLSNQRNTYIHIAFTMGFAILRLLYPYEQGSKDAMKGFNYDPPSLLKICDLLCVAIGGLM